MKCQDASGCYRDALAGANWCAAHLGKSAPKPPPCDQLFNLQGVVYACEREQDHGGDHVYAFTAGQLQAVLYKLQQHSRPAFPSEAVLLAFGALGIAGFAQQRSATDWAVSLYMCALAVRWLRIWTVERKGSSRS